MTAPVLPTRLRSWANARTAAGTVLAGFVLAVVYVWLVSPWLRDHMGDERLLDEMPWRTPAALTTALATYGESGQDFYRNVLLIDFFFPIVYSIPLVLSVAFAAPRLHWLRRFARIPPLLPIAGGIFDWGENLVFLIQMDQFPDHGEFLSWVACAMTLLKFTALILSVFVILCGLWMYRRESRTPSYRSNHQSR